jgi:L-amino acid N-acyltransferase YncA
MRIRPVTLGDAEATRAIYNVEVLESTVTFDLVARSLAEQRAWIAEHSGGHPAIVAVGDDDHRPVFAHSQR